MSKTIGIYSFKCTRNGKVYIGSSVDIRKRKDNHLSLLRRNKHYNTYFQNIFNKYGEESLKFSIIEECSRENLLEREIFYITKNNNDILINIVKNDIKRPSKSPEIRRKISKRIKEMFENGELSKTNKGSFEKGTKPWNTGKKYKSTEHLKVPKKSMCRKVFTENLHKKMPIVYVFNSRGELLFSGITIDILNESLKENNIFVPHMKLRNPKGRNGYFPYILKGVNINKSIKTGKPYKGLNFTHQCPSLKTP